MVIHTGNKAVISITIEIACKIIIPKGVGVHACKNELNNKLQTTQHVTVEYISDLLTHTTIITRL